MTSKRHLYCGHYIRKERSMIKLAFCDDDLAALNELERLLERYRMERGQEISHTMFHSSFDLLAEIERGVRFDILFLDVLMPGENGIDAATEIRNYDSSVKIIFLTSSPEFAVQSYTVGAYFYQLKPICADSFYRLMDSVLAAREEEKPHNMILRCKSGIAQIDIRRLEYCEVIHRTLIFHMTSGKVLESTGNMDDLCSRLKPYGNFLRPHRSYLINLDCVQNLSTHAVTMSCQTEIPIPRGKYNEIKNAFLEHAFQNRQVVI